LASQCRHELVDPYEDVCVLFNIADVRFQCELENRSFLVKFKTTNATIRSRYTQEDRQ